MEIRSSSPFTGERPVVATRPGGERHSREGQWQPAPPARTSASTEAPDDLDTLRTALRGRWVTDARRESEQAAVDERARSRQMRQRLEETYRADSPAAAATTESAPLADPLDLVV